VVRKVMIDEELLEALLEGRVKLRRDIKLKYGKYRMVRRYIRAGVEGGGEGKGKVSQ
jgi:hypothetical protein